jgi:hypothetical protein
MPKLFVNAVMGRVHEGFTGTSSAGNTLGLERSYGAPMLSFAAPLLSLVRLGGSRGGETCLVCSRSIRAGDERVHLPGGGHVHRGCATYRMRQHARTVRRIGAS